MMDIITGRAPPPARAESYLSKGSRELRSEEVKATTTPHVDTFKSLFVFGTKLSFVLRCKAYLGGVAGADAYCTGNRPGNRPSFRRESDQR